MTLFDTIILNRNLRKVTDNLVASIQQVPCSNEVFVVDSGSRESEVSEFTFVRATDLETFEKGLRISRGFNLGLESWKKIQSPAEWVLLLPNDAELEYANVEELFSRLSNAREVSAIVPTYPENPYAKILEKQPISLAWNFPEGPIFLRSKFINDPGRMGSAAVFDQSNFRGYMLFLDLALQMYASNHGIVMTNLVSFKENKSHLLSKHNLIGTEPYSENLALLLSEGRTWMMNKYGFTDKRNLESLVRLCFQEFIRVNSPIFPEAA